MPAKLRLSEADRERFGGPEWVVFDKTALEDMDYEQLAALEKPLFTHDDLSLALLFAVEWPRYTVLGIRAVIWIARQVAGVTDPQWEQFKPNIVNVELRLVRDGDVDPPEPGSSEPPSETEQ